MNQKCPDHQLVSVYFDGELPSPWKEKMESHLATCAECSQRLQEYRRMFPKGSDNATLEQASRRVWQSLQSLERRTTPFESLAAQGGASSREASPRERNNRGYPLRRVLRRNIAIPLPAAAAILLLVALAFLTVVRVMGAKENTGMILASEAELNTPDIIPISDMESVLQYLGDSDNGEIIILRLPESRNFVNYGEPAILRAADYSRQMTERQRPGWNTPGRNTPGWRKP